MSHAASTPHPQGAPATLETKSSKFSVGGALGDVLPEVVHAGGKFAMAWPAAFAAIICCAIITGGFVYASVVKRVEVDMSKFATADELKAAIAGVKSDYDRVSVKIDSSAADMLTKLSSLIVAERAERLAAEKEARDTLRSVESRVIDLATRK